METTGATRKNGFERLTEPVDLAERIRLGVNALVGGLDPTQGYTPYWNLNADGFRHAGMWDRFHDVPRALHALGMAERATGEPVDEAIWEGLGEQMIGLFDEGDELPGTVHDESGERHVHLHNIREAAHGLAALIRRGDGQADEWARRMVRRLLEAIDVEGQIDLEKLPDYVGEYNWQPSQEGRAVDALVRLFRLTGDEAALELAGRMVRYARNHCFTEVGQIREAAGAHGHSLTAMVAGMADFALVTRDAELLLWVKRIYDVGCPRFNSSFGWSMESLHKYDQRGESNNTGDLLRATLLLGKAGWSECFEDAERILRGHLLPSQLLDVGDLPDEEAKEDARSRLASRALGGFAFPTPNAYQLDAGASLMTFDITSGAVDGLCEALWACAVQDEAAVRVNLHFDCRIPGLRVRSELSREGRLEIEKESDVNAFVRLPSWMGLDDLAVEVEGETCEANVLNSFLAVPRWARKAVLTFSLRETRTIEWIDYEPYTIDWRGDQIVAMSPPGEHRPLFPPCPGE